VVETDSNWQKLQAFSRRPLKPTSTGTAWSDRLSGLTVAVPRCPSYCLQETTPDESNDSSDAGVQHTDLPKIGRRRAWEGMKCRLNQA